MSIFDRERSEIAKLFSEELELGLYSLSSEATYRVISVDGIPAQHTILISCYNDEVYLPFESRSNTNRLTVTDLDYDVRYGQVVNHANIDMRVLNDGMNAENYNSDIYIPSNTKVSLRDLLIRAYQLGGYGSRHDLLNSNEITEEEARMAVAEAVGALTSNEAEPSMQTDKDIRLDTPQAVKEALASGKDLYNPQTGEFWWEYNYTPTMRSMIVGSMSRPFPLPPSRSSPRKSRSQLATASTSWTQGRPPASTSRAAAPWSPWTAMITKS